MSLPTAMRHGCDGTFRHDFGGHGLLLLTPRTCSPLVPTRPDVASVGRSPVGRRVRSRRPRVRSPTAGRETSRSPFLRSLPSPDLYQPLSVGWQVEDHVAARLSGRTDAGCTAPAISPAPREEAPRLQSASGGEGDRRRASGAEPYCFGMRRHRGRPYPGGRAAWHQSVLIGPGFGSATPIREGHRERLGRLVRLSLGSSFGGLAISVVGSYFLDVSHRRRRGGIGGVHPRRFHREPRCCCGLRTTLPTGRLECRPGGLPQAGGRRQPPRSSAASRPRRTAAVRSASRHCSSEAAVVSICPCPSCPLLTDTPR